MNISPVILHLPDSFLPQNVGGKEVFVYMLSMSLNKLGLENHVAIHSTNLVHSSDYVYDTIPVKVLQPLIKSYLNIWNSSVEDIADFENYLLNLNPDVVHFHDQSSGASLTHLRIIKKHDIPTVLTYHSPGQSCPQRSLLFEGKYPCNGKLDEYRCSYCLLRFKGSPKTFAKLIARNKIKELDYNKYKINRIFAIRNLVKTYIDSFKEIYTLHNYIQVHAIWCKKVLMLNGVPENKIFFTPQGINHNNDTNKNREKKEEDTDKLKIVFVGRCDYVKGVHILIDAVKMLPKDSPLEVHFLGPYWNTTEYGKEQLKKIINDKRFKSPLLVPPNEVNNYLKEMDVCVIPSIWPETGPLILLQAFCVELPVIGTNYAGISEYVVNGQNGFLFENGNKNQLAEIINMLLNNKTILKRIRMNIALPRSIDEMAIDIFENLYNKII